MLKFPYLTYCVVLIFWLDPDQRTFWFLEKFCMIIFIDAKNAFAKLNIHSSSINFLWIEI